MSQYNFKKITVVPSAKEFIDIVLSMTQRKTPTVIHKHYDIHRIRSFYMRKVKYTQQNFHDKLSRILEDFPQIGTIHPFYSDLMNILYEKEHYKIALGQINNICHQIDRVGKEYVKLLKYGDSLYRCKILKKAAMGRMATMMKGQKDNLKYLEDVRQHLSRLPSINPDMRTLLLCGFPNVGKSSFINKITRADVEVQPYPFTTKSLYVGHTDYNYDQWQVIDTPGILDHSLEDRNSIEMLSISALAHLNSAVLYVMDISEQCGHSIEQQIELFQNNLPILKKDKTKTLIVALNKIDVLRLEELPQEKADLFKYFEKENVPVLCMSTVTNEGVSNVKEEACKLLRASRIERLARSNKVPLALNRINIVYPEPRDGFVKPEITIPAKVLLRRANGEKAKKRTEREIEIEMGDDYILDLKKNYDLPEDYKYDIIPEIMDGKNIADFIDPDIMAQLNALELEEEEKEARGDYENPFKPLTEEETQTHELAEKIREKIAIRKINAQIDATSKPRVSRPTGRKRERSESRLRGEMSELGVEMESRDQSHFGSQRSRSRSVIKKARLDEDGHVRSSSKMPRDQSGVRDAKMQAKLKKVGRKAQGPRNKQAKKGEGDHHIYDLKPKHLFSGKRGMGSNDRR